MTWKETASQKKLSILNAIPEKWRNENLIDDMISHGFTNPSLYLDSILPISETKLVKKSMIELLYLISTGELTSLELTIAICHRAALSHQLLNNCIDIFFEEAIQRAKKLDDYFKLHKHVIGPLHGIPISLKDQFDLPGKDSSIGFVGLANKPRATKSLLADKLESYGAIFYCKTTVPMAMMYCETESNLHGYTLNGVNIKLSSGGSSGGEGSLIGSFGSVIGLATDIGGSIRIPSSHQGLYALKPAPGRLSYMNVTNSHSGQQLVPSIVGPMGHSLEDVTMLTKLMIDSELWKLDPDVLPIPWKNQSELKNKRLNIGIWFSDGEINPHPPILRGLKLVKEILERKGYQTFEIKIPMIDDLRATINKVYGADARREVQLTCDLSGEPIISAKARKVDKEPYSVNEWWKLSDEVYLVKQKFWKWWNDLELDAIVAPIWPSTSTLPHGLQAINYTTCFNITEASCTVIPVTTVNKEIDSVDETYSPLSEFDKINYDNYVPELFDKMPVCVQVVCLKLQEEKSLAIASFIDEDFKRA